MCTDCHGIHSIKAHTDPNSPVSAQNVGQATCARCHEGVRLSQEFGSGRPARDDLSGELSRAGVARRLAGRRQLRQLPRHAQHLPFERSALDHQSAPIWRAPAGSAIPALRRNSPSAKVHVDAPLSADIGSKAVRWIRRFYLSMIFAVIGGMLLHNFIIWRAKVIARRKVQHDFVMRMPHPLPRAARHAAHQFHSCWC